MPRSKSYDVEQVFSNALIFVRKNGYRGCDMDRLIQVTQFNRRAFYLEFGKKELFFNELTKFYIDHSLIPMTKQLYLHNDMHANLTAYFNAYHALLKDGPCLLVRLLSEIGNDNSVINTLAKAYYDELTQHFIASFEKSKHALSSTGASKVEQLALQLMFLTQSYALTYNLPQGKEDIHLLLKRLLDDVA
ncbi:MAG: hypothetical protein AAGJ37_11015 [Pseudomonadota bacterium]